MKTARVLGFTLIELLFVISIVGLLSSIVIAINKQSIARASDVKQVLSAMDISRSISMYINDKGTAPRNFGNPGTIAWSTDPKTFDGGTKNAFEKSMDLLIAAGSLKSIPTAASGAVKLGYLDYGKGSIYGGMVYATRTTGPLVTNAEGNSCRIQSGSPYQVPPNASLMFSSFPNVFCPPETASLSFELYPSGQNKIVCTNGSGQSAYSVGSGGESDPTICTFSNPYTGLGGEPLSTISCADNTDGNATMSGGGPGPDLTYNPSGIPCGTGASRDYCLCNQY